jgi:hypothetical protein
MYSEMGLRISPFRLKEVTADMETHRTSIDDHNKSYYEMKKKKDALQAERKCVYVPNSILEFLLVRFSYECYLNTVLLCSSVICGGRRTSCNRKWRR